MPSFTEKLFRFGLFFYPEQYRKKYGQEMIILFQDMYQEEIGKKGHIGLSFWLSQIYDITKGIIEQHRDMIEKKGMKKYIRQTLHINTSNIIGSILLLPIFVMFGIDLVSRIVQRDLLHYNRPVYSFISHTPLYWFPLLFTWVILFPTLAVLMNCIPLIKHIHKKQRSFFSFVFLKKNIGSVLILSIGLFFLAVIKLHDVAPCMVHGFIRLGIGQVPRILSVCKNA